MTMKKLYFLFLAIVMYISGVGQITINMPGDWDGWSNPPSKDFLRSDSYSNNPGQIHFTFGHYQTMFNTLSTNGDLSEGNYTFLFTRDDNNGNVWADKWGGISPVQFNQIQEYIHNGTDNSITLIAGKYYIVNFEKPVWDDVNNTFTNSRGIFFELSDSASKILSVWQDPAPDSVVDRLPVKVFVKMDKAPAPEEKVIIRYTGDNWATWHLVECTISNDTAIGVIPEQWTGTSVSYYIITTAYSGNLSDLTTGADVDLITIYADNNGGQNYNYTVSQPQPIENYGINMPGFNNDWSNPPDNAVFASELQSQNGGVKLVSGLLVPHYQTVFNTLSTGGDVPAGSYEFLFTSGDTTKYIDGTTPHIWDYKWSNQSVTPGNIVTYNYQGANNNSITLNADKYYVVNFEKPVWDGVNKRFNDSRGIFFELSDVPTHIVSVSQDPDTAAVLENQPVTVTINLDKAPAPEEKVILRGTFDGWQTDTLIECTVNGTTATAVINAKPAETSVQYYVFTTAYADVMNLSSPADFDLVTIDFDNNSGSNYVYRVKYSTSTGLEDVNNKSVLVYPNPAQDIINVTNAAGYRLDITDLSGRVLKSFVRLSSNQQINVSDIQPGIYLFKFSGNGKSFVNKVSIR